MAVEDDGDGVGDGDRDRDGDGGRDEGRCLDGDGDGDEGGVRDLVGDGGSQGGEAGPVFIDRIMAVAEDAEDAWWERRKRNPKRMGEVSQAAFLMKAQSLGFGLAVPWGDSEKYDFVVWAGPEGRLLRVQVKATGRLNGGGYDVQPVYSTRSEGKKTYTERDIDVLAAHVIAEGKEVWYLLPVRAFAGEKNLRLFPDMKGRNPRWEGYREAWEWLRVGAEGRRATKKRR